MRNGLVILGPDCELYAGVPMARGVKVTFRSPAQ